MKSIDWPDFSPYQMHLISRLSNQGVLVYQLLGSSKAPQFHDALLNNLGFQRGNSSGEMIRQILAGLSIQAIQQHFPLVTLKPTPSWKINVELARKRKENQKKLRNHGYAPTEALDNDNSMRHTDEEQDANQQSTKNLEVKNDSASTDHPDVSGNELSRSNDKRSRQRPASGRGETVSRGREVGGETDAGNEPSAAERPEQNENHPSAPVETGSRASLPEQLSGELEESAEAEETEDVNDPVAQEAFNPDATTAELAAAEADPQSTDDVDGLASVVSDDNGPSEKSEPTEPDEGSPRDTVDGDEYQAILQDARRLANLIYATSSLLTQANADRTTLVNIARLSGKGSRDAILAQKHNISESLAHSINNDLTSSGFDVVRMSEDEVRQTAQSYGGLLERLGLDALSAPTTDDNEIDESAASEATEDHDNDVVDNEATTEPASSEEATAEEAPEEQTASTEPDAPHKVDEATAGVELTDDSEEKEEQEAAVEGPTNFVLEPDTPETLFVTPHTRIKEYREVFVSLARLWATGKLNPEDVTEEDRQSLAKFVGWSEFNSRNPLMEISELPDGMGRQWINELPSMARNHLQTASLTSYYTPSAIIEAMWDGIRHMGFQGGEILDPSVGSGRFIGLCGEDGNKYRFHGVDYDPVAAQIAETLYPQANIQNSRYEKAGYLDNTFDLAITNVPFENTSPADDSYAKKCGRVMIHDYYFLKALDQIKEGGVVAFITSSGTLDKENNKIREAIAEQANLLAAFRLPVNSFQKTTVSTDILFLQKRTPEMKHDDKSWVETTYVEGKNPFRDDTANARVNSYFVEHPENIVGEQFFSANRFCDITVAAAAKNKGHKGALEEIEQLKDKLIAALPEDGFSALNKANSQRTTDSLAIPSLKVSNREIESLPAGSHIIDPESNDIYVLQGQIRDNGEQEAIKADVGKVTANRLRGIIKIRDAALKTLKAQNSGNSDAAKEIQKELNKAYDAFVKKYGPINSQKNESVILREPHAALIAGLESSYDIDTNKAEKAAIFSESQIRTKVIELAAKTPADALNLSLNAFGRVNLDFMLEQLEIEMSRENLIESLRGDIFYNPANQIWEPRMTYLAGNVRKKIKEAEVAMGFGHDMSSNIEALEMAKPLDIPIESISLELSNNWIPTRIYSRYIAEKFCGDVGEYALKDMEDIVSYSESANNFTFLPTPDFNGNYNYALSIEWETGKASWKKIINHALNNTRVNFTKKVGESTVPDPEETAKGNQLIERLRAGFEPWVRDNPEIGQELETIYNNVVNIWSYPEHDGSYLTLPGLAEGEELKPHQKNFVARAIQEGGSYNAHVVGGGKTLSLVATAMEYKRLGLANKPSIVVPKQVLMQFAGQAKRFYPNSNILVVQNEDLKPQNRGQFLAKVALHDWDVVLMTHSMISRIPVSFELQKQHMEQELMELSAAMGLSDDKVSDRILKRRLDSLEVKLEKLIETNNERAKEPFVFEQLGIDALLFDEAHAFKNLGFPTRMARLKGVSTSASAIASHVKMICDYVRTLHTKKDFGVIMASGTPVSNSISELYVAAKLTRPSVLEEMGLSNFDAWLNLFGRVTSDIVVKPSGSGSQIEMSMSKYANLPELLRMLHQFMDIKTQDDLKLKIPEKETLIHNIEPNAYQKAYTLSLAFRASCAQKGIELEGYNDDPVLLIYNHARLSALDMHALTPDAAKMELSQEEEGRRKSQLAAENIFKTYEQGGSNLQLVFSDISTPSKDRWNVYADCRKRLIEEGIPENEIEFVHDHDSDSQKLKLFERAQTGKTRVLFGSTSKLGTGVNVQRNVTDIHFLTLPHRPSDLEQAIGRGLRFGNLNSLVRVHYLTTTGSIDARMASNIKRKDSFVAQLATRPEDAARGFSEQGDLTYDDIVASTADNELIKEKTNLEKEIKELETDRSLFINKLMRTRSRVDMLKANIESCQLRLDNIAKDKEVFEGVPKTFEFKASEDSVALINAAAADPEQIITPDGYLKSEKAFTSLVGAARKSLSTLPGQNKFNLGTSAGLPIHLEKYLDIHANTSKSRFIRAGAQKAFAPVPKKLNGLPKKLIELANLLEIQEDKTRKTMDSDQKKLDEIDPSLLSGIFPDEERLSCIKEKLIKVNSELKEKGELDEDGVIIAEEFYPYLAEMSGYKTNLGRPLVPAQIVPPDIIHKYGFKEKVSDFDHLPEDDNSMDEEENTNQSEEWVDFNESDLQQQTPPALADAELDPGNAPNEDGPAEVAASYRPSF